MSDVFKPQLKFIPVLLTTVMLMRGNVNFRNMSRYSTVCEKTFSRQSGNPSDSAVSDMIGTEMYVTPQTLMIAATDSSFIPESGNGTYGLGRFYNGSRSQTGKGLGISQPAVADVSCDTAYSVSGRQTPDKSGAGQTCTDRYPEQSVQDAQCLPPSVRYPAADGYYAGKKSADGVSDAGYFMISELRHDADLRCLYTGKQKARSRRRICDGKVRSVQ